MIKYLHNDTVCLLMGDCVERLKSIPDASIDAIVTDPPYELGFMGKSWDAAGIAYNVEMWQACLRVLKPGGHLLSFGGTRTYHRMACAIEDAGFEIRDSIHWIYGSGFPKSRNVAIAIDKDAGAMGHRGKRVSIAGNKTQGQDLEYAVGQPRHEPITDEAKAWDGWGTALKPAHEPIIVARKPLAGNVADNVRQHGTGALNIDGCRVATTDSLNGGAYSAGKKADGEWGTMHNYTGAEFKQPDGRWPANILLAHSPECESYQCVDPACPDAAQYHDHPDRPDVCAPDCAVAEMDRQGDGASRFFPVFRYQAKAPRKEREAGLAHLPEKSVSAMSGRREADRMDEFKTDNDVTGRFVKKARNTHPTVKPVALMEWLVKLVTPPDGIVLDPFMGSGTTGIACVKLGFEFLGIEREENYFQIAEARIAGTKEHPDAE